MRSLPLISLGLSVFIPLSAIAQDNTVYFNPSAPGITKSIAQWGVEVVEQNSYNMRQSIAYMGANNIDLIATGFWVDQPLQANGQIAASDEAQINTEISIASMAGNKPLILGAEGYGSPGTDPSYLESSGGVNVREWAAAIEATKSYYNSQGLTVAGVMPFNEPDYWGGEGTPQNLHDIMALLKSAPGFQGVSMIGPSTLDSDAAQSWYNAISDVANYGSTHVLAGSADSYADFFQQVSADGGIPSAPEMHELGEAIYAAEYGAQQGIWWGPALLVRGLFVQASQGEQLGYAENRPNDTAAAVYRAPNGNIYAFAGGFERMGTSTPYRFVSTNGPVYFNGIGPINQYMIQVGQGSEAYADIQTSNPEPALDGNRWEIVNRQSGQVLQVAGSSTSSGALVNTASGSGALNQLWNITRNQNGYYDIFNANSGLTMDVSGASISSGAGIDQNGTATSIDEQWYIQPAGNGYYYIVNGNSELDLTGSATDNDQIANRNSSLQQWQFVPANPTPSGTLTAQYNFQGNVNDSTGVNNATAVGSPSYVGGPTGLGSKAISLNGTSSYVQLPSGVANTSAITVAAWVQWNGGAAWQRIFDFGNNTTSYMFLTPLSGNDTMRFAITNSGGTGEQILDTDPLPVGQWVHLAVTLTGETGVLYEDGAPIVAGQIQLNPADFDPTLNYIGKSQYSDPLFSGMISDFQIFDYALSQSQIAGLVSQPSLVSTWNLSAGGDFNTPGNWTNGIGAGLGAEANFTDRTAGNWLVTTNSPVTVGTINFNSVANITLADAGNGTGSLTLQTPGGTPGLISVQAGAQTISLPLTFASSANVTIAPNASLSLSGPVTINSGLTVTDTPNGGKLQVGSLSIASGAALDLTNNTLLINFGNSADPAATIRGYLVSGHNATGAAWTGSGIVSSTAAANPTAYTLGYADGGTAADVANTGVPAGELEIKYTVAGDVNLSGSVDLSDLVIIASDFGMSGADWAEGDLNYDGNVDLSDLVIVASNFGASLNSLQPTAFSGSFEAEWKLALEEAHASDATLPEPALLAVLGLAGLLLGRRRR